MLEVKEAGQKTSLTEQGTPCGAQEGKKLCYLWNEVRLHRKVMELWFMYSGRRHERPKLS